MNLPIRLLPGAGESFGSYLRRAAHALGTTPRMLATGLDLTPGETNSLLLDPATTHRIAERLQFLRLQLALLFAHGVTPGLPNAP